MAVPSSYRGRSGLSILQPYGVLGKTVRLQMIVDEVSGVHTDGGPSPLACRQAQFCPHEPHLACVLHTGDVCVMDWRCVGGAMGHEIARFSSTITNNGTGELLPTGPRQRRRGQPIRRPYKTHLRTFGTRAQYRCQENSGSYFRWVEHIGPAHGARGDQRRCPFGPCTKGWVFFHAPGRVLSGRGLQRGHQTRCGARARNQRHARADISIDLPAGCRDISMYTGRPNSLKAYKSPYLAFFSSSFQHQQNPSPASLVNILSTPVPHLFSV